jgi:hypothetical protein
MKNKHLLPLLLILATTAVLAKQDPRVYNPHSRLHGKSFAEWAVEWWQLVLQYPQDETLSPLFDTTGALCNLGRVAPDGNIKFGA